MRETVVSLPDELVEAAREEVVSGRAAPVSAFVAEALADRARGDALSGLLAEMTADGGAPSPADRAWAREALGLS